MKYHKNLKGAENKLIFSLNRVYIPGFQTDSRPLAEKISICLLTANRI